MNVKLQSGESGELSVEESAVRAVVEMAIGEASDGQAKVNRRFLLGSAIRIKEGPEKRLVIDLELTVPYGVYLPDAMREVQERVQGALHESIGVENSHVNVVVTKVTAPDGAERAGT